MASAEDQRHLAELVRLFGAEPTLLPDTSDTLDGPALMEYERIPSGGTPLSAIRAMSGARGTVELGRTLKGMRTGGDGLAQRFDVPLFKIGTPVGLRETDGLCAALEAITGAPMPKALLKERGRLVDALVDGHKYVFGKRVVVYGEPDLAIGLTAFLAEMGAQPVLVATGAEKCGLAGHVAEACGDLLRERPEICEGVDFHEIAEKAEAMGPELLVGNSKGYPSARKWNIPLIRTGFPIHDRFGGQRILHMGYKGALGLYDAVVNAVLEKKQSDSPVGYGYL
jgi:nitrogenase molybdenum-iron protein NifN